MVAAAVVVVEGLVPPAAAGAAAAAQGPAAAALGPAVAACMCVAERRARPSGGGQRGVAQEAAPARRLRPAGVWLAVFAGKQSTAQCLLALCWLYLCLIPGPDWTYGGPCLYTLRGKTPTATQYSGLPLPPQAPRPRCKRGGGAVTSPSQWRGMEGWCKGVCRAIS